MKVRDIYNLLVTTFTAAIWSFMAIFLIVLPMMLLGLPQRVAAVLTIGVVLMSSGFTAYGAYCIHRERIRRAKGQCIRCGYNLQGVVDRCPECGKRFTRKVAA